MTEPGDHSTIGKADRDKAATEGAEAKKAAADRALAVDAEVEANEDREHDVVDERDPLQKPQAHSLTPHQG